MRQGRREEREERGRRDRKRRKREWEGGCGKVSMGGGGRGRDKEKEIRHAENRKGNKSVRKGKGYVDK